MSRRLVPVLEIGGTHVTAAAVETTVAEIVDSTTLPLDGLTSADELLDRFAAAMNSISTESTTWGAAVPGPFDYDTGIARYRGVGKFESLNGVDVGQALRQRQGVRAREIRFVNDADAVLLGEIAAGHLTGHRRCVAITLGTGVGSAYVADGRLIHTGPGVPPDAEVHLLHRDGVPLEDIMSRRALLRDYRAAVPDAEGVDVRDIAERARRGDPVAGSVFHRALSGMCEVLRPSLRDFGATVLVVGGSIARSWDLVAPTLRAGLGDVELVLSSDSERAALLGAAAVATRPDH